MKISWHFDSDDIKKVKNLYDRYKDNPFVRLRIKRNLDSEFIENSKEDVFKAMVSCLLTTQQRSGPDSPVTRFINSKPFPLNYRLCLQQSDIESFVQDTISKFGGLRRSNRIALEVQKNLDKLENGLWDVLFKIIKKLKKLDSIKKEREAAEFVKLHFLGFGPKQSRNLLQSLGYTKYKIPIDSRITKWLNIVGFPVKLSSDALSDNNYYSFVSDGIQELCKASNIKPCVLDAIVFVSFDKAEWTDENVVW
jgi:thermostable 8-oxoguanine DNA glycosylase